MNIVLMCNKLHQISKQLKFIQVYTQYIPNSGIFNIPEFLSINLVNMVSSKHYPIKRDFKYSSFLIHHYIFKGEKGAMNFF